MADTSKTSPIRRISNSKPLDTKSKDMQNSILDENSFQEKNKTIIKEEPTRGV